MMRYFPEYTHNLVHEKRDYKGLLELQKNRKKSNTEAFNTDYFTYLRSGDSPVFTTPLPGSNSSDCSKRSTVIGNQEIS